MTKYTRPRVIDSVICRKIHFEKLNHLERKHLRLTSNSKHLKTYECNIRLNHSRHETMRSAK